MRLSKTLFGEGLREQPLVLAEMLVSGVQWLARLPVIILENAVNFEQTSSEHWVKTPLRTKIPERGPHMSLQTKPTFRHRHSGDGVIDSICSECLLTVASARIEFGLIRDEEAHVCDPVRLHRLRADRSRLSAPNKAAQTSQPPDPRLRL